MKGRYLAALKEMNLAVLKEKNLAVRMGVVMEKNLVD
jgi:hypothetical protein